jgi:stringent starvation protein B
MQSPGELLAINTAYSVSKSSMSSSSLKPYLIRAVYEWIVDNNLTPYLLVDAQSEGTVVPVAFVQDGRIVLNLRPEAINGLSLGNDFIIFNARFSGKPMQINVPIRAVLALYAQENGRGMIFDEEEDGDGTTPPQGPVAPEPPEPKKRPTLTVVK